MARPRARFRLSLKDRQDGETLKIEPIPAPNETPFASNPAPGRYRIRVNGRVSAKIRDATLADVFHRLRRWLVSRVRRDKR
jgi:hypothetical protein